MIEKRPGETPWIGNIHVFAIASTMSFGPSGSSINAMTTSVRKLVDGLTRGLFKADLERHWQSLLGLRRAASGHFAAGRCGQAIERLGNASYVTRSTVVGGQTRGLSKY